LFLFVFFQAEDGIRDRNVTGVQTCALPISDIDEVFTIAPEPCCSIWRSSCFMNPMVPKTFSRNIRSHTLRSCSAKGVEAAPTPEIGRASCRERAEAPGARGRGRDREESGRR